MLDAMRHFLVLGTDAPGSAALRERLRPIHRAWLRNHPGHAVTVLHGGPTLDGEGKMNGTLLIVSAAQESEACKPKVALGENPSPN